MLDFGNVGLSGISMLAPLILMLLIYGFIAYFLISILRFMRMKNRHDQERNNKLDEIITLLHKNTPNKNDKETEDK